MAAGGAYFHRRLEGDGVLQSLPFVVIALQQRFFAFFEIFDVAAEAGSDV